MTTWTIPVDDEEGGHIMAIEVPDGWELITTEHRRKIQAAATFLSDLDRSEVGRHKGDAEGQSSSGISQGNPYLKEGQRIGTTLSGKAIYYPYFGRADLGDPSNWVIGDPFDEHTRMWADEISDPKVEP